MTSRRALTELEGPSYSTAATILAAPHSRRTLSASIIHACQVSILHAATERLTSPNSYLAIVQEAGAPDIGERSHRTEPLRNG